MGMSVMRSSSSCSIGSERVIPDKNPKPSNFEILEAGVNKEFTIAKVRYPDCDNFEGLKILVYKGHVIKELVKQTELDPHFCNHGHLSPIARFAPTDEGLKLALNLTFNNIEG